MGKGRVIDVCTYNGEADLWDIHYNVLKDHVDQFVVIAFDETFSGVPRETHFPGIEVSKYPKAVFHFHTKGLYEKYRDLSEKSPNTQGADHWKREFMQKESIKDALGHLKDNDIVVIGDVDEVINPSLLKSRHMPFKAKLKVYTYWLNNRSSEEFGGRLGSPWHLVKGRCLNHMRTRTHKSSVDGGWHFTSMGGAESLRKKLTDSYTQETYAHPSILQSVAYNIENGLDFLGRPFTYTLDESQWPKFLRENREKYRHLMSPEADTAPLPT